MFSTCSRQAVGRLRVATILGGTISRGTASRRAPFRSNEEACDPLALRFGTVLFQARHDFDQIAGAMSVIELVAQDALPGILAGAWRAGQTEDVGPTR